MSKYALIIVTDLYIRAKLAFTYPNSTDLIDAGLVFHAEEGFKEQLVNLYDMQLHFIDEENVFIGGDLAIIEALQCHKLFQQFKSNPNFVCEEGDFAGLLKKGLDFCNLKF